MHTGTPVRASTEICLEDVDNGIKKNIRLCKAECVEREFPRDSEPNALARTPGNVLISCC